jgi:hypothetical protein
MTVRSARFGLAVVLLIFAALSGGCDIFGKMAAKEDPTLVDVTYSVRSAPDGRVKPGGYQSFFVEQFTDDSALESGGSDHAPGTWRWSVTGPADATIVSDGGSTAHWTAPQTEGTYRVTARFGGSTPMSRYATINVTTKTLRTTTSGTGAPIVEEGQQRPAAGTPVKILETGNTLGVRTGAKAPTFKLSKPAMLVEINDYHYIEGGLPAPGTIGVRDASGKLYGPWPCTGSDGQGGVKNAFWSAKPNAALPAGTYTVVDSGPKTWSTNGAAKGLGFCTVNVTY